MGNFCSLAESELDHSGTPEMFLLFYTLLKYFRVHATCYSHLQAVRTYHCLPTMIPHVHAL